MGEVSSIYNDQPQEMMVAPSASMMILDAQTMESMMKVAELMATGNATVPVHLQKSPADCMAVIMQAMQWRMNPFAVAQKTHLVSGTLGYEAQLVNAVIQASGAITGRFHYEYTGEGQNISCRVGAVISGENEIVWSEWLCASSVTTKNSPLWKTNPKQQIGYLQVKNWARAYCPGAILGVYTADELETVEQRVEKNVTPRTASEMAEAARHQTGDTQERFELLSRMESIAMNMGLDEYNKAFADIGKDGRKMVGAEDHKRIKELADACDRERAEAGNEFAGV